MEAVFSIIIWILVIVSFVNKLNKKRGSSEENNTPRVSGRDIPMGGNYMGRTGHGNSGMSGGSGVSGGRKTASRVSGKAKTKDIGTFSTTEYLENKARQEELADRKERYQEWKQAKRESSGSIPAAKRLYEGDSVPHGMERVRCSYCAADNLIPEGSSRKYTCYFCREEL